MVFATSGGLNMNEEMERPDDFVLTSEDIKEGRSLTLLRLAVRRANGEPVPEPPEDSIIDY